MILLIDNYDSFTYNLVQFVGELGAEPLTRRNDAIELAEVRALAPRGIIISPGPGRPEDAGVSIALVREFTDSIPILGVCLGHQAIGAAFGGSVELAPAPIHGKTESVAHDGDELFSGVRNPFAAGRYHSLVVGRATMPAPLRVIASTGDGLVMAVRHRERPVFGVQFHPESILTEDGRVLLRNFLSICGELR
jgi:anthranilate synthase/aminodeoxychorismate synthase-like glutamine amidotransferase